MNIPTFTIHKRWDFFNI